MREHMPDTAHISDAARRAVILETIENKLGLLSVGELARLMESYQSLDGGWPGIACAVLIGAGRMQHEAASERVVRRFKELRS